MKWSWKTGRQEEKLFVFFQSRYIVYYMIIKLVEQLTSTCYYLVRRILTLKNGRNTIKITLNHKRIHLNAHSRY